MKVRTRQTCWDVKLDESRLDETTNSSRIERGIWVVEHDCFMDDPILMKKTKRHCKQLTEICCSIKDHTNLVVRNEIFEFLKDPGVSNWDQLGQAWGIKNWELEPALEKIRKYSCLWVKKAMDYKQPLKEGWHRWESTLRAQCASSSESLYQTKDEPQEAQEQSDLVLNHHWAQLEA